MTCGGRPFQMRAAATGKARSPTVDDGEADRRDVEPQSLPAGIVPRRGTMALSAADTCKQGRQA